jgi:hypothetical protein
MRILFVLLLLSLSAQAQKVTIAPETREIEGLRRKGMSTLVEYDKKTVDKAWTKFLKTIGKPESWKSGATVILEANITQPDFAGVDHVTRLDATTEGTKIFWSIGLKGDYAEPTSPLYEKAKTALTNFCKQLYRDDLADQIDAAEKVADVVSRTHDKTVQMGEHLRKQLERNAQDQASLVKSLEEKKAEAERLKQEIAQNKIDQESALEEIKKVRKIAEDKKAKMIQNP